MELLGIRDVSATPDHLLLTPQRIPAWAGREQIRIPYRAISAIALVEGGQEHRGRLSLSLHDGTVVAVPFARRATLRMRAAHHEARKRVRADRRTGPDGDAEA